MHFSAKLIHFFIRMVSQLYFYHLEYYLRKFCFKQNKTILCNFFLRIVPICNTQIVVDTYRIVPIHLWYSTSCRYLSNCPHLWYSTSCRYLSNCPHPSVILNQLSILIELSPSVILNQLSILVKLSPSICDTQPVIDTYRIVPIHLRYSTTSCWYLSNCHHPYVILNPLSILVVS